MDMKTETPKTVIQWLETLPDGLRERAFKGADDCGITVLDKASSLGSAITYIADCCIKGCDERFYWVGVSNYIAGIGDTLIIGQRCEKGYNAAKAAYEAQPNPVYTHSDTHDLSFEKGQAVLKEKLTDLGISYVSISPERLAELEGKAAKWDAYASKASGEGMGVYLSLEAFNRLFRESELFNEIKLKVNEDKSI